MTTRPISQATPYDKRDGLRQYIRFRSFLLREIPKVDPQILRPSERKVLRTVVARWLAVGHNVRSINVTISNLSEHCDLSVRSIKYALRRLESLDLIFPSLDRQLSGIGSDLFVNVRNVARFIDDVKCGKVDPSVIRPQNGGFRGKEKA